MRRNGADSPRQEALFHLQEYAKAYSKGVPQIPIPIEQIAEAHLGLAIERGELKEGISGQLHVAEKKIVVNSHEPLTRQRFTIAHEMGHFCLHVGSNIASQCPKGYSPELEREANSFAAALLLPPNLVLLELADEVNAAAEIAISEGRVFELSHHELDMFSTRLAKRFLVSKSAMDIFLSKRFNIRRPSQLSLELGIETA
jgi:Zn-dependent peptidase ImmA (M78 family)